MTDSVAENGRRTPRAFDTIFWGGLTAGVLDLIDGMITGGLKERLSDGREDVIEVRKPGVDGLVQIDLEILAGLVDLVDHGRVVVLKQTGGQNVSQIGQL
jgi:hypothetical protein